ncbi:MAG: bifunctional hydroxymethylpyrimidine kinase/phosphomethylpyrimidine kinase [Gemmatimonadetes bacterium]|nr:bifunctional hydroxymethylpyrimidine kinase/phosphomethylpyrimidine kinase [Gemmatimonadota bacterium]
MDSDALMDNHDTLPVALTIAGSDSGGGAGIQADLKTFHQWRVYGTSAVTAVTAQNTLGVQKVHPVPADVVAAQIRSVAVDIPPRAVKSGMLASSAIVHAVAGAIRDVHPGGYVLDPVMVASSGDALLEPDAVSALRDELIPLATVVTPNWPEAALLAGVVEPSVRGMDMAARAIVDMGAGAVLVKGGHVGGGDVVDVFRSGTSRHVFRGTRVETRHTHGTGCTLSAAIAAALARGTPLEAAVETAIGWVREAIARAPGLGAGHGPVNHFTRVSRAAHGR